jgi:hypothetical protein
LVEAQPPQIRVHRRRAGAVDFVGRAVPIEPPLLGIYQISAPTRSPCTRCSCCCGR